MGIKIFVSHYKKTNMHTYDLKDYSARNKPLLNFDYKLQLGMGTSYFLEKGPLFFLLFRDYDTCCLEGKGRDLQGEEYHAICES